MENQPRLQWRQLFSLMRQHLLARGHLTQWNFVLFGDELTAIGRAVGAVPKAENDN